MRSTTEDEVKEEVKVERKRGRERKPRAGEKSDACVCKKGREGWTMTRAIKMECLRYGRQSKGEKFDQVWR